MNGTHHWLDRRLGILVPMVLIWLACVGLVIVGRGDVETLLKSLFRRTARRDAFALLNGTAISFLICHTLLTSLACIAAWNRRIDIMYILLIGPAIAILLCMTFEEWSDPNWHDITAIGTIGWFVGTVVSGGYWFATFKQQMITSS